MVLGLSKKNKNKQSNGQVPVRDLASSDSVQHPHKLVTSSGATVKAPPTNFKYGNAVSKYVVDVAGLPVNVFGLNELTMAASRASAPPPPDVCIIVHLHGRGGSADNEEKIARQLYDRIGRNKNLARSQGISAGREQRDHLIVTFDARNHGHRTTNPEGQKAWKQGNDRHAMDLYGMIVGDARDTSFLIDFLPSYLFPQNERCVAEWVVTGKSLGGHSAWHVLANEPRIRIGVPMIGMPDFGKLLHSRTRTSFVTNGPPYVPASLKALIEQIDPARTMYHSWDARQNPFWNKKICVLSGAQDKLVLWDWNEDFLNALVVGEPTGPRGEMDGLKITRREGVGHEVNEDMVEEAGEWIWRWGVNAAPSSTPLFP